ncbi:cobalamin binding intrinsic factor-like isoform X2 [Rhinatrema bivittatum]|uniref:cobalamin binding intrinsic factor-like isoform X2 n=1 Tax=Rhinatrema bivittatum TaxID=194408 RepID=UPI0011284069|nr:cobalamin binding intrinsic factor-like isoform X2 [Rhinatrema bivittatum]
MLHPGSAGKIPRMLPLPLCVLLLLAVCTQDVSSALCSVPANQQSLVTALLHQMIRSVGANVAPNPSVLLAMNLAGKPDVTAEKLLVQQLKDDAVQKLVNEQTFTSGQVALYILALRSSCENPFKVSALGKTIDLVFVLEGQLKAEVAHIEKYQSPLTTYYQVALDILALCEEGSEAAHPAAESLAKASLNNQPGSSFSVDTASVAVLALTCVFNGKLATDAGTMVDVSGQMRSRVKEALSVLTAGILKAQKSDGVIGDIYSTGLAAQALTAVSDIYPVSDWNCPMTMAQVIAGIPKDTFFLPMAASQVLPFLKGKTYLDVSSICVPENVPDVVVEYMVLNDLQGESFKFSIWITVSEGSVLLDVLEKAAQLNPKEFSFTTEQSSLGVFVTSIHGLAGSSNDKTYWQFYSGTIPLKEGVGTYRPKNKEHILAIFSKY